MVVLKDFVNRICPKRVIGNQNKILLGITDHSKRVLPGWVFVARKGAIEHGKHFIGEAIKNGASCIITEESLDDQSVCVIEVDKVDEKAPTLALDFYDNPERRLNFVGITGTNGKTTTAFLLQEVLSKAGFSACYVGTLGIRLNSEGPFVHTGNTTPDPFTLAMHLSKAVLENISYVVMEVSSHSLAQSRIKGIKFSYGIFTNLSHDHLDYHGTMESYFKAKSRLFSEYVVLSPSVCIINGDDPYGKRLYNKCKATSKEAYTYGFDWRNSCAGKNMQCSLGGMNLFVKFDNYMNYAISTPFIGVHNAYNILSTITIAKMLAINPDCLKQSLIIVNPVPGRMERIIVDSKAQPHVFVDYAHTPSGVEAVLKTLRGLTKGRLIGVLGCGGNRDPFKREIMGGLLANLCDVAILTQDNPRDEDPERILKVMERGALRMSAEYDGKRGVLKIEDRFEAIKFAISNSIPKDVVVILGKGHEDYQLIRGVKYPFNDRKVARQILEMHSFKELL